ncbi:MAG: Na+/H+ antiporter NhaC family protein [bacterium]
MRFNPFRKYTAQTCLPILLRRSLLGLVLLLVLLVPARTPAGEGESFIRPDLPGLFIKGVNFDAGMKLARQLPEGATCRLSGPGLDREVPCHKKSASFGEIRFNQTGRYTVELSAGEHRREIEVRVIHGIWTLLPPLLAIGLALLFRQVVAALWVAIWLGAFIVYDWRFFTAIARSVDHYIINAMADPGNAAMLVFIIFIGGMIGMISKSGGIQGIVEILARRATSPKRGQVSTFLMGLFIFFDDYANTIIVGSAMRPVTDRLRVSREKLSYLVDSTAAPVASIFPISTWIGYEVGLIDAALSSIGSAESGYMVFLESILYRFYPILALALVVLVALTGRDFGPMRRAEKRARQGKPMRDGALPMASLESKSLDPPEGKPRRWYNALLPLVFVIGITFVGLWINGKSALGAEGYERVLADSADYGALFGYVYILGQVYSEASPNIVLAWASLSGCIITVIMITVQRILTMGEAMNAWLSGVESMVIAIVVLLFAWSLGQVCEDLHTAEYLTTSLAGVLSPRLLPVLTFLLACTISFSTGTSYGTMAILMPLVIPIGAELAGGAGLSPADTHVIIVGSTSSVLAGAVFGDHCSPISDTTIMSSMATSADHVDHVRTQVPYAVLAAVTGIILGDIPTAFGMSPLISIVLGIGAMAVFLYLVGQKVDKKSESVLESAPEGKNE